MADKYKVYPYDIKTLNQLLEEGSGQTSLLFIENKLHSIYFEEYFGNNGVKACTIVVEKEYVDRDFLEDYAEYYVRCFQPYGRTCSRLHFFNTPFIEKEFTNAIKGKGTLFNKLQKAYLGFVVVKPLPQTIVGRTCLITYPNDNGRRSFPIKRHYEANLFGIPLCIDTLAFQEQDSVVAACATSALWSAFHGTGILFHHPIPSPAQITKAATKYLPMETRTFPNKSLTLRQMSHAIRDVGLEPLYAKADDGLIFKSLVYGYLKGKIPAVLGGQRWDISDPKKPIHHDDDNHAIAITGFSLPKGSIPKPDPATKTLFISSCIDEIYAHDDQVGPFARMKLDGITVNVSLNKKKHNYFSTSISSLNGKKRFVPQRLMFPVYHKIRIPLETVKNAVSNFDDLVETFRLNKQLSTSKRLHWSLYLTTTNDFKNDLRQSSLISTDELHDFLCKNLPKFLWRATAVLNGIEKFDLLFDATDIEQGKYFITTVVYDNTLAQEIRTACSPSVVSTYKETPVELIIKWFIDN